MNNGSRLAEPVGIEKVLQSATKPNSVRFRARASPSRYGEMTIPLAPALLMGSSNLPGDFRRAAFDRLPIWSCSVWGFACHACCQTRGALLPHLFTLTRLRSRCFASRATAQQAHVPNALPCILRGPAAPKLEARKRRERRRAVYFLCHWSVGSPRPGITRHTALWSSDFPLPSALRGWFVGKRRTRHGYTRQRSSGQLQRIIISWRAASPIGLLRNLILLELLVKIAARRVDHFRGF